MDRGVDTPNPPPGDYTSPPAKAQIPPLPTAGLTTWDQSRRVPPVLPIIRRGRFNQVLPMALTWGVASATELSVRIRTIAEEARGLLSNPSGIVRQDKPAASSMIFGVRSITARGYPHPNQRRTGQCPLVDRKRNSDGSSQREMTQTTGSYQPVVSYFTSSTGYPSAVSACFN